MQSRETLLVCKIYQYLYETLLLWLVTQGYYCNWIRYSEKNTSGDGKSWNLKMFRGRQVFYKSVNAFIQLAFSVKG